MTLFTTIAIALDIWARKEPAHGTQAGGTQPPAEGKSHESMGANQ